MTDLDNRENNEPPRCPGCLGKGSRLRMFPKLRTSKVVRCWTCKGRGTA